MKDIAKTLIAVVAIAALVTVQWFIACDPPPLGNDAPAVVSPKPIILTHFETQYLGYGGARRPYNRTHVYNNGQHSYRVYYMDGEYVWSDPYCAWLDSVAADSTGPRVKVKDPPEPPTQKDGE